jgi:hypothetical protein
MTENVLNWTLAREPRFQIGQQFKTRGKHPRICTVRDILKTYNSKGEMVKVRYVATHDFMGQDVTDWDVIETTIAIGSM